MNITAFGDTHIGLRRKHNEDDLLVDETLGIFAVADGLGGLPGGQEAANDVIALLEQSVTHQPLCSTADLRTLFEQINSAVYTRGRRNYPPDGNASTLTVLSLCGEEGLLGHIGDSAAYHLRNGILSQVAAEHTMAAEAGLGLPDEGPQALPDFFYHTLTRCIGQTAAIEPDLKQIRFMAGDRFVLATDGLGKVVPENLIAAIIVESTDPGSCTRSLIDACLERHAPDNVTVISLFFD